MKRRPVALLDACVLVPMPLADTLLRLAEPPSLFAVRWSAEILEEVTRTLERRFGKSPDKARYREMAMREFFPEALVDNYHQLIRQLRNHPKDRHVLAAALACEADYLVTFNLKDFPSARVCDLPTKVIGPSRFLNHLLALDPTVVRRRLTQQASAISIPLPILLEKLETTVPSFVAALRQDGR